MFSKVSCYDLKDAFTRNQPQHRRVARGSPHPDTAQARHHGRGHQEEEQQLLAEGELVELETKAMRRFAKISHLRRRPLRAIVTYVDVLT